MNELVPAILGTLVGTVIGAVVWSILAKARQRAAVTAVETSALRASTALQVELSSVRAAASRVPDLERGLSQAQHQLGEVNEKRARLEAQVSQLADLETRRAQAVEALDQANQALTDRREKASRLSAELTAERDNSADFSERLKVTESRFVAKEAEASALAVEVAELRQKLESEQSGAQEKLEVLLNARDALTDQFKSLANDILEEKSKRFTEQNQTNLGALLDPLKTRINEFQAKIEDTYIKEGNARTALGVELVHLKELNQQLSEDAKNLTRALKGSSKTQGIWGEWILEKVLESSGLRKGEEYVVQSSHTREDGSRVLPDVIIHLPEGRSLVVDSKVSLVAYEEFAITEDEATRAAASKRHMDSIKGHIKGLSDKKYQTLYSLNSLDFVLLFVPIEPAFMLAVASDRELFMDAWNRNVLLVSPSTLLFVVRTVAHLWRQEAQSRNAQDIAKRGADLYDKFVGFVEDMNSLGGRLKQAQGEYDSAFNKLSNGRGNLVGQAEKLRLLGVKPSKSLAPALIETALESEETHPEATAGDSTPAPTIEIVPQVGDLR